MTEPRRPAVPAPRAVAAARRLVGPAKVLGGVAQVLWVTAAIAAAVVSLALAVALWQAGTSVVGVIGVVLLILVLFVPAWWLHHARGAFADVVELPARLETLGQGRPKLTIDSRQDLADLRTGGVLKAARTIRTTIGEVTDFLSPASTVVEVASPPFWAWTSAAVVATGLLVVFALAALVFLVFAG